MAWTHQEGWRHNGRPLRQVYVDTIYPIVGNRWRFGNGQADSTDLISGICCFSIRSIPFFSVI